MQANDYAQIMIMEQATCLGCGIVGICLEVGVCDDGLTLACEKCIVTIFEKARQAIESRQLYEQNGNDIVSIRIMPDGPDGADQ